MPQFDIVRSRESVSMVLPTFDRTFWSTRSGPAKTVASCRKRCMSCKLYRKRRTIWWTLVDSAASMCVYAVILILFKSYMYIQGDSEGGCHKQFILLSLFYPTALRGTVKWVYLFVVKWHIMYYKNITLYI